MRVSLGETLLNSFWKHVLIHPPASLFHFMSAALCVCETAEVGQEVPLLQLVLFDTAIH